MGLEQITPDEVQEPIGDEVIDYITLHQVSQICEDAKATKNPEDILEELSMLTRAKLQEISEREGGLRAYILLVMIGENVRERIAETN